MSGNEFKRIDVNGIPVYTMQDHRWALYGWMEAREEKKLKSKATLIHVDAHDDLECPFHHVDYWQDFREIAGLSDSQGKLERIRNLISSGGIVNGINNLCFILPAMYTNLIADYNWVVPTWEYGRHFQNGKKLKSYLVDRRTERCGRRVGLLDEMPPKSKCLKKINQSIIEPHGIKSIEGNLDNRLVLDIDLDYFSHQGAGDQVPGILAPMGLSIPKVSRRKPKKEQLERRVKRLFDYLKERGLKPSVVTIAKESAYEDHKEFLIDRITHHLRRL